MMMSPGSFIEFEIKGKSYEEAASALNELKSETERLEKLIEEDPFCDEMMTRPAPDTIIDVYKQYFRAAKKYFEEQGWTYSFPDIVYADERFNEKLNDLTSISLSIGLCFGGQELQMVIFDGDKIISNYSDRRLITEDAQSEKTKQVSIPNGFTRIEYIKELQSLHIGEWDKEYHDPCILDGTEWEAEFKFEDGDKIVFRGANKYPWNFYDFLELLGMEHCLDE